VIYPGSTPVGNATLVVANVLTCNKHSQIQCRSPTRQTCYEVSSAQHTLDSLGSLQTFTQRQPHNQIKPTMQNEPADQTCHALMKGQALPR
jgi:hypothetical protein